MNTKLYVVILTGILLAACSSRPSEITYYHLNDTNASPTSSTQIDNSGKTYVQVASIKVPDYLKQSKLVLRTAPFEMHFAASHLWVQTPEKEIRGALVADLNAQSSHHYFVSFDPIVRSDASKQLSLEITHFYPTEDSEVIMHGYWTLVTDTARYDHKFQFKTELELDGYAHAVAQQRFLISALAKEITLQIHGK